MYLWRYMTYTAIKFHQKQSKKISDQTELNFISQVVYA